jgi:hypothetical protein
MPKPKNILKREDKQDGWIYACPYCRRYVVRASGLQQCAGCGGMVDNDNVELRPANTVIRFDGKDSWR